MFKYVNLCSILLNACSWLPLNCSPFLLPNPVPPHVLFLHNVLSPLNILSLLNILSPLDVLSSLPSLPNQPEGKSPIPYRI